MLGYFPMMHRETPDDTLFDLTRRVERHGGDAPLRLKLTTKTTRQQDEDRLGWQQSLQQNTSITTVDVRVMHLPDQQQALSPTAVEDMYQVLSDLRALPNLTVLKISGYCEAFPLQILAKMVREATKLTHLSLTSVKFCGNQAALQSLSSAVANHTCLSEWRLLDCQMARDPQGDELDSSFLDTILQGIAASPTLVSLSISPTRPNALGSLSLQAIQSLTSLQSLKLGGSIGTLFSPQQGDSHQQTPFDTLMSLLTSNKTNLRYLHIPFVAQPNTCQAVHDMLVSNTTLRELALRTYTDQNAAGQSLGLIAQGLKVNSSLQDFELLGPMRLRNPTLLREFARVLEVNYTLHDLVLFELVVHTQHCQAMSYQAKLNQHGRAHWLQCIYDTTPGSNSKDQQVAFLQTLAQDPDDAYYYLSQMNPNFLVNLAC